MSVGRSVRRSVGPSVGRLHLIWKWFFCRFWDKFSMISWDWVQNHHLRMHQGIQYSIYSKYSIYYIYSVYITCSMYHEIEYRIIILGCIKAYLKPFHSDKMVNRSVTKLTIFFKTYVFCYIQRQIKKEIEVVRFSRIYIDSIL